jgi:hypothetical protein
LFTIKKNIATHLSLCVKCASGSSSKFHHDHTCRAHAQQKVCTVARMIHEPIDGAHNIAIEDGTRHESIAHATITFTVLLCVFLILLPCKLMKD